MISSAIVVYKLLPKIQVDATKDIFINTINKLSLVLISLLLSNLIDSLLINKCTKVKEKEKKKRRKKKKKKKIK